MSVPAERHTAVGAALHTVVQEELHTAVLQVEALEEGRGRRTAATAEDREEVHVRRTVLLRVRRTDQQEELRTAEMGVRRRPSGAVGREAVQQELRTRSAAAGHTRAAAAVLDHTETVHSPVAVPVRIPAEGVVLRTAADHSHRLRRTEAAAGHTAVVEVDCSRTWCRE